MRKRTQAREFALQILYQLEMNPGSRVEIQDSFWDSYSEVPDEVRRFAEGLVDGTLAHQQEIDEIVTRAAENWENARMAVIDRNILRFATYELLFVEDIPPKVTINEAINLAKKFSQADS